MDFPLADKPTRRFESKENGIQGSRRDAAALVHFCARQLLGWVLQKNSRTRIVCRDIRTLRSALPIVVTLHRVSRKCKTIYRGAVFACTATARRAFLRVCENRSCPEARRRAMAAMETRRNAARRDKARRSE